MFVNDWRTCLWHRVYSFKISTIGPNAVREAGLEVKARCGHVVEHVEVVMDPPRGDPRSVLCEACFGPGGVDRRPP